MKSQDTVNMAFLGHLGDPNLIAGIGLGASYLNLVGLTLIHGILMAMDTLVSQAKGAGNLELCGVYLNRSRFVLTMLFIPMVFLSFYVEKILVAIGMNPSVSNSA